MTGLINALNIGGFLKVLNEMNSYGGFYFDNG